ncbi:MAG: dTDP-4-dehydrorhamnose reductase [Syntrophobacterales bacterium]|nr:dTDP-4-dehydrorhamnose reductase [Syntrophobacterales bacterium]
MKILVLGHTGMLGSDIVNMLILSHEVMGKNSKDFDISSLEDCRRIIGETAPDVVINATAYTNVDGCESEKDKCFSINAEGVKNVAVSCRDRGIKIVHFSTDYVFDGEKESPYVENDLCNPVSAYGQSKLQGELYLKELSNNYILIRTAWLYGKNGKNFVNTILEKAKNKQILEVVDDQTGSPTYTIDLASAVNLLIEGDHAGTFHLTNRGTCNWYQFTLKILEYANKADVEVRPIKSDKLQRKAPRPYYSVFSCRKFTEVTKRTMRYWQIALKDYINRVNF